MTITKETVDAQNATVKISITPQDYEPLVSESLKKLSKKVEIKGFRKGFVPLGHIRKLYGNEVLAEELNNLINKELTKYLTENNIEILGSPLPHRNGEQTRLDISEHKSYEFCFDLGLNPVIEITALNPETKITRYKVIIDDEAVDKEVNYWQKRHGQMTNPEDGVVDGDILLVKFIELDEGGNVKEGGVQNSVPVPLTRFKDPVKEYWMGKKPGESIDVELLSSLDADEEGIIHYYLKLKEHRHLNKNFRVVLEKINRIIPAEINQALFDQVFGQGQVKSADEFRQRVKRELEQAYQGESLRLLNRCIADALVEKTSVPLPDEFLKRWLQHNSEKPLTREQVEHDYDSFSKKLKWALIASKIKKDNKLEVSADDMKIRTQQIIRSYYKLEDNEATNKMIAGIADEMLKKEEHVKRTYDELADRKVLDFIKSQVTLVDKDVTVEEFNAL